MGPTQSPRQFRINPVEATIFSAISLLFLYSVYHLFQDGQAFQTAVLNPSASPSGQTEGRNPAASAAPVSINLDIKCGDSAVSFETKASKARLEGVICGAPGEPLAEPKVRNQTNEFQATVFPDPITRKFRTDYIPLNPGKNVVMIHFEPAVSKRRSTASDRKAIVVEITKE